MLCHRKLAFTLVEMLVVVALIAVLLALMLPSMRQARFTAEVTRCAAQQADLVRYIIQSATDDRGRLGGGYVDAFTGRNTWDVGRHWADGLLDRGMPITSLACPQVVPQFGSIDAFETAWYARYGHFRRTGYAIWISREFNNGWSPPDPGDATHTLYDTRAVPGPKSLSDTDRQRRINPIASCIVETNFSGNPNPVGVNLADADAAAMIGRLSSHRLDDALLAMNQSFVDGSTQTVHGGKLKPRYRSNNGQPIMWR